MAKGSQLSQLKSALSQAGLSRQQQNGKKRKRALLDEKEKEKKAARLREIQQKMNPFDVKVTKLKHDVGGRKIAGVTGRPAQSKQAGMEQRKKTLLKELQDRDRSGGIIDRRFGENDPTMTPEERMLERFTRERQRGSKGAAFNLEDEDELTHYGQSLSKLDDFDNVGLGLDEEEDEEHANGIAVQKNHFGGFSDEEDDEEDDEEGQPDRKRSKAEIMAEVVAKSKEHKFMRQAQQEEDENLRHELDQELESLRSLLYAPEDVNKPAAPEAPEEESHAAAVPPAEDGQDDKEYDQFVRELAFEKRAKPKDRTKTEEELALEEKAALEKAERQRIRRMTGEEETDDSDDEGSGRKKRRRERGGDDLEDDFMDDEGEWGGLGAGLGGASLAVDSDVEGDEEDEDLSGDAGDSDESEDEDSDGEDVDEDEGEEGEEGDAELLVNTSRRSKKKSAKTGSKQELPFTFPCPSTHDEFLEIVEDVDDSDIPTVVKRIRTLHHPSLAEDNKLKLQALIGVLIDHVLYITSPPTPKFSVLSALIPHLFALTRSYPIQSAEFFVEKLKLMQKNLRRGLSHGVIDNTSKTWPSLPELSLLRVVGLLWSTSDMNHHVVSPARLLMASYLGLCRVRSVQDIASGLFLCTLFLQYEDLSKRLVPEVLNFLLNTVLHLAPHKFQDEGSLPGSFPTPDFRSERCLPLALHKAKKLKVQKPDLTALLCEQATDDQSKVDLLSVTVDLLGQYGDLYKSLSGFIELYQPVVDLLGGLKTEKLPSELSGKVSSTVDTLQRLLKFSRQARRPLALQAHKPIPISTYIPRFEQTSSNYLRNRDPDHERNEAAKLRAQYKQERKGAIRELRKDARFLAAEQQKVQKEKDKSYNERMRRVMGSIESERAEQKAMEKEKMKEKKRAGRK